MCCRRVAQLVYYCCVKGVRRQILRTLHPGHECTEPLSRTKQSLSLSFGLLSRLEARLRHGHPFPIHTHERSGGLALTADP